MRASGRHHLRDDFAHLLDCLDRVRANSVGAARRSAVPSLPEQLADQRENSAGLDGLAGCRVLKVALAKCPKPRVCTDGALTLN